MCNHLGCPNYMRGVSMACADHGGSTFQSKAQRRAERRAEVEQKLDEERMKLEAEQLAEDHKLWGVIEAIEVFIDAKISYAESRSRNPEYASERDVSATRDALEDKLRELLR